MTIPTKREMKEYRERLIKEARKFKLTAEDLSNLYDLFYMVDNELFDTLKINHMDKWMVNFHKKIERIVIPELYEKTNKRIKLSKKKK